VTSHDIVVIGASAGGVEAISALVAELPHNLRAAVLVVLHLAKTRSVLPEILTRVGRLPAVHPTDGQTLHYGRIYVAPPDRHMTLEGDAIRLNSGPTENGVRPAVDPLFRSAARTFGSRVIGIVLTGSLDDGTAGLAAIKEAGGLAIVQDPREAFAPSMPRSAIENVRVDHVLPLREIPVMIATLAHETTAHTPVRMTPHLEPMEPDLGEQKIAVEPGDRRGRVSVLSCPDCHGSLWEVEDDGILRFRCRVGHVYSAESMLAAHTDSVDRALWAALRALEERAALTRKLAARARQRRHGWVSQAFEQRALESEEHAAIVKEILRNRAEPAGDPATEYPEGGEPVDPVAAIEVPEK
jgi:two-component system chemotaxis response regulator CheB